jgi:hypothetical protein
MATGRIDQLQLDGNNCNLARTSCNWTQTAYNSDRPDPVATGCEPGCNLNTDPVGTGREPVAIQTNPVASEHNRVVTRTVTVATERVGAFNT